MGLSSLDIVVLVVYFVAMIAVGVYVTRRASRNLDSYFLGEKSMPWWLLGVSNASAMWDITGTMWLVYILFVYGMKAIFLPWLWPIFNQVFDAVYLSSWIRKSNARTGAEWIATRFGATAADTARAVIVVFALVSVVGFLFSAMTFRGMGKFCKVFLPWDFSPNTYAIAIMGITAIYVVLGGMLSVVLTDFVQFILMALSSVVIAIIAMNTVDAQLVSQLTPAGWYDVFSFQLALDWSSILPAMNQRIVEDAMASAFSLFFLLMVSKGVLVSMAGSAPNYDMQQIFRRQKSA